MTLMLFDFPAHYERRISHFDSLPGLPPGEKTVVLLGDSITEAFPGEHLRGHSLVNLGISGDQTILERQGVLRRLAHVAAANPAEVFLLIGINDLGSGKNVADLVSDHRKVVDALHLTVPGAQLYVQSTLPTSGTFGHLCDKVMEANREIRRITQLKGIPYIDLFSIMSDQRLYLREDFTIDGLHLNEAAYIVWRDTLEQL